ncbi:MAG: CapA family protein [Bacteroidales bacterium]
MLKRVQFLFAALLIPYCLSSQKDNYQNNKLSILFIGDIMGHDEQIWSAEDRATHTYNYDDVFKYIEPEVSEADLAIANLEVTLAGTPYSGYPAFSSPVALAKSCYKAGIDCFVSANNHAADRGKRGIINTIFRLDSLGIPHTGTFFNNAERDSVYPLILRKKGFSLALLNYTYGTNGINVPPPEIVNMLDRNLITADIAKAKSMNPDAIILFLHWGTEYDTIPSKSQTDLANYFFGLGVDLIIGSHPHVLQKMIWTKNPESGRDNLLVYSLGNFVSNQRRQGTDGGSMVKIVLERRTDSVFVSRAGYYLTWVYTPIESYRKRFFILPCEEYINKPEFFPNQADYLKMNIFIGRSRDLLNTQNINIGEISYPEAIK